jgi:hypothetical protein
VVFPTYFWCFFGFKNLGPPVGSKCHRSISQVALSQVEKVVWVYD